MMINILILVPSLENVSPVNAALALAKGMSLDHKITLVSFKRFDMAKVTEIRKIYGSNFDIVSLDATGWLGFFKARIKLSKILSNKVFDVAISFLFKCDLLLGYFDSRICKISSIRNMYREEYCITYGPFIGFILSALHTSAIKKFSAAVAMSNDMVDFLIQQGISRQKVFFVPNFLDETRVNFLKNQEYENCAVENDYKSVISTGSLIKRKRFDKIISNCLELYEEGVLFNLLVVGDGPLMSRLVESAHKTQHGKNFIKFFGHLDNPLLCLKKSDIFIMASESEGVSRSLMEALYFNKPCLISEIPGNREFSEAGNGVHLFCNNSQFKTKLKEMLLNPQKSNLPHQNSEVFAVAAYKKLIEGLMLSDSSK